MNYCCEKCFSDNFLKEYICCLKIKGECSYCKSHNIFIAAPKELKAFFDPLISLYKAQVEFMPVHDLKRCEGRYIWEILTDDWGIFDDSEVGEAIIEEIYNDYESRPLFLDNYVDREDEYRGAEDEYSDKLTNLWKEFCNEIIYNNRFFPAKTLDKELLGDLLEFLEKKIPANTSFYRARNCFDGKTLTISDMGSPPPERAIGGRANPIGIPYLYLSSDYETAIAEIRPQIGEHIAVSEFIIKKGLNVVDLRNPLIGSPFRWRENLEFYMQSLAFLRMLGAELSKPVNNSKSILEYLPTQYLCEFIKNNGFKGVMYKSYRSKGNNLVLFSSTTAEAINIKYYQVNQIQITSKESLNDETSI